MNGCMYHNERYPSPTASDAPHLSRLLPPALSATRSDAAPPTPRRLGATPSQALNILIKLMSMVSLTVSPREHPRPHPPTSSGPAQLR